MMKFEYLPNEILMECFRYLNSFEIFYSFDLLNNRFHTLIHTIPLSINFDNVTKTMFDRLCQRNSTIPNQIYAFKIGNQDQCFQAKLFLAYFPWNEFSSLQKFQLNLPMEFLDSQLTYGQIADPFKLYLDIKLSDLLVLQLRILTIPYVCQSLFDLDSIPSIISLTIAQCHSSDLHRLFRPFPQLKYLHINHVKKSFVQAIDRTQSGIYLEKLVVDQFSDEFNCFELFVEQIPNLKSLTISNSFSNGMFDGNRWKQLIISSLPFLNSFKFKFHFCIRRHVRNALEKSRQFQTDFWQDKQWYTEYSLRDGSVFIHTIPYPFKKYQLEVNNHRHSNGTNSFVRVRNLTIELASFNEDYQDYFPNVTSINLSTSRYRSLLTHQDVQFVSKIVNLSNVKHLEIRNTVRINDLSILLELFKQTSRLSSMAISSKNFQLFCQNEEVCQNLNRRIRMLEIPFWNTIQLDRFCQIFSNLEHLNCWIDHEDQLLFLIENLPKLSTFKANWRCKKNPDMKLLRFKAEMMKFNIIYHMEKTYVDADTDADTDEEDARDYYRIGIFIWIGVKTLTFFSHEVEQNQ